jgi:hypothetical protein
MSNQKAMYRTADILARTIWNGLANASSARKFRGRKSAVIFADVDRPVLVPVEGRAQRDSNL